jgi:phospholipid/cholesterol/gamma-HCH transport system substrate-binding protein
METKANYVVVGIFTLGVMLSAFGFVYWTARMGETGETVQLRFRIPGSASGLGRGSFVLFNGVKVGDVRRVFIDVSNPDVAIADTEVDILTPITKSTTADIGIAGLTGQAHIQLKGGDPNEPNLLREAEEQETFAVISANPSAVTNLLQTAQDIFDRAESVLGGLERFVEEARSPLLETVENARTFSAALANNSESIDSFLASVGSLSETLSAVSGRLDSTLKAAEDILKAVDSKKIDNVLGNVEAFTEELKTASGQLDGILKSVDGAVLSVKQFSENASETLSRVDKVIEGVDPKRVESTLANIEHASRNVRVAAEDIATVTDKFGSRAGDIDQIITDASELAAKLNKASGRIDGVIEKVENLLGSGEGGDVMKQASETLKSFRKVADTLSNRIGPITDGLVRFSGKGLRDLEALIRDARRAINRIEESVSSFERNPQRIITGGEGNIPRYNGRRRR